MVYVRSKTIKGNTYYYLVKSSRVDGKVKQTTIAYLGTESPTDRELSRIKKKYGVKKETGKGKRKGKKRTGT